MESSFVLGLAWVSLPPVSIDDSAWCLVEMWLACWRGGAGGRTQSLSADSLPQCAVVRFTRFAVPHSAAPFVTTLPPDVFP